MGRKNDGVRAYCKWCGRRINRRNTYCGWLCKHLGELGYLKIHCEQCGGLLNPSRRSLINLSKYCSNGCKFSFQVGKPGNTYKHTEEAKERIRQANLGRKDPLWRRVKISRAMLREGNPNYGKPRTEETRKKISEAQVGKKLSAETKRRISEAGKGREILVGTRIKLSWANKGLRNPAWKHGRLIGGKRYPAEFRLQKREVLERDGNTCLRCGRGAEIELNVDHIDGDIRDNGLDNLQTLCEPCHKIKDRFRKKRGIIMNFLMGIYYPKEV